MRGTIGRSFCCKVDEPDDGGTRCGFPGVLGYAVSQSCRNVGRRQIDMGYDAHLSMADASPRVRES